MHKKNEKKTDQAISSHETNAAHTVQTDPLTDPPPDQMDQVISSNQIKKGDCLTLRDGCEFLIKGDQLVAAGTALEVTGIGKKGMYSNQLQVKLLGDNSCACWIPIANIELSNVARSLE